MRDLSLDNMADDAQIGQVLGLDGKLLDQLRELKAFKPTQNWNMFRKPGTLMRRESTELGRMVMDVMAGHAEQKPRTVRRIIAGDRGTGKSLMLLQAMSMAFLNDWVVINIPEGTVRKCNGSNCNAHNSQLRNSPSVIHRMDLWKLNREATRLSIKKGRLRCNRLHPKRSYTTSQD